MNERVTRLEVEFEHVRKDLDEIKADQKAVLARLAQMPTVTGLWGMIATVIGVGIAIAGLTFAVASPVG